LILLKTKTSIPELPITYRYSQLVQGGLQCVLPVDLAQALQLRLARLEVLQLALDLLLDGHVTPSQGSSLRVPFDGRRREGHRGDGRRRAAGFQEGHCGAGVQLEGVVVVVVLSILCTISITNSISIGQGQGQWGGGRHWAGGGQLAMGGNETLHYSLGGATEGELPLLGQTTQLGRRDGASD